MEESHKIKLKKFDPSVFAGGAKASIMNPEKVLEAIGIEEGQKVADFGSGVGFFALPAAAIVGKEGQVFAIDVNASFLGALASKARDHGFFNLKTILANLELPEGSKLDVDSIDWVMMFNILHQSSKKEEIIKEAKRILRPGGGLVIIEWKKEESVLGPDLKIRISPEEIKNIISPFGFEFKKEIPTDMFHYGLVFQKH